MDWHEWIPGIRQYRAKTNYLITNNYLLDFGEKALIDASFVPEEPVDLVVLTHCHWDHIYMLGELVEAYKPRVLAGWKDVRDIEQITEKVIPEHSDKEIKPVKVDQRLKDGDKIDLGNLILEVLETPGHTEGSISLWNEEKSLLFSGDTLFNGAVGRWDLPSGNEEDLWKSVSRLESLPYKYLFPGHGKPLVKE